MPEMDGVQTFKQLRLIRADLPVILVSGFNDIDLGSEFGSDQPFAFLQKPFSIGKLDDLLRAAVRSGTKLKSAEQRPEDRRPPATPAN